ncbi:MAG: hypothetical protein WC100_20635, partial [Sterolibacterium sp.]
TKDSSDLTVGEMQDIAAKIDATDIGITLTDVQAQEFINASVDFAAADDVTVHAHGTQLENSIANLQTLGVDSVVAAGTAAALHVTLGDANLNALPSITTDGTVTVGVTDDQAAVVLTNEHAGQIHAAGIDQIHALDGTLRVSVDQLYVAADHGLGFAASDAITEDLDPANLALLNNAGQDIQHAVATGLHGLNVDVVNLADGTLDSNAADELIAAGVSYAQGGELHVAGTHLDSSIADLQTLGVTSVLAAEAGAALHVSMGSEHLNSINTLPTFADIDQVNLDINAADLLNLNDDDIAQLQMMHVDSFDLSKDVSALGQNGGVLMADPRQIVDFIDHNQFGITLSDAQAQEMLYATNAHFAEGNSVAVHAAGTHLDSSVHDLQALGVDTVDGQADGQLVVKLGNTTLGDAVAQGLPQFDPDHKTHVELVVNQDQTGNIGLKDVAGIAADLKAHGIDAIDVQTSAGMAKAELADSIAETTTAFEVSDELANVLLNAGLLSSPADKDVNVNVADSGGHSVMSLVMMGELGVDQVDATNADIVVQLGFDPITQQDAGIDDLVAALGKLGDQVFAEDKHVELDLGRNLGFGELNDQKIAELKLLGIDVVKDDSSNGGGTHNL